MKIPVRLFRKRGKTRNLMHVSKRTGMEALECISRVTGNYKVDPDGYGVLRSIPL